MAETKLDLDQAWKRLLDARTQYEGAREQLKNLHLGVGAGRESGQRKQQLVEFSEKQRDDAASDIATCMLIYQEAARARDAASNASLTSTNLDISKSMKTWAIIVGVAAVAQTIATVLQLVHGWICK